MNDGLCPMAPERKLMSLAPRMRQLEKPLHQKLYRGGKSLLLFKRESV